MTAAGPREEILVRLRHALRDRPSSPALTRDYRSSLVGGIERMERFIDRVSDYRADVRRITQGEVHGAIGHVVADIGARALVVPPGTPKAWLRGFDGEVLVDDPPLTVQRLDAAGAVISGSTIAIAETGTIVLDGGPGQGRRVLTLLPDHHICIVMAEDIVGDVPEAVGRLDPQRPLTWISGPSATSDIELSRVEGVHGPRNLHVIVVTSASL